MTHRPFVLWFTGLSGSGKSTLATAVGKRLTDSDIPTYLLDGDIIRTGLCKDLGFTDEDRKENIRRIAAVSNILMDAGIVVHVAAISPRIEDRQAAREDITKFIEVFCNSDLETCENRDVKGLYGRARAGEIPNFTGIDSPYEKPTNAEIVVPTGTEDLEVCVEMIIGYLKRFQFIS